MDTDIRTSIFIWQRILALCEFMMEEYNRRVHPDPLSFEIGQAYDAIMKLMREWPTPESLMGVDKSLIEATVFDLENKFFNPKPADEPTDRATQMLLMQKEAGAFIREVRTTRSFIKNKDRISEAKERFSAGPSAHRFVTPEQIKAQTKVMEKFCAPLNLDSVPLVTEMDDGRILSEPVNRRLIFDNRKPFGWADCGQREYINRKDEVLATYKVCKFLWGTLDISLLWRWLPMVERIMETGQPGFIVEGFKGCGTVVAHYVDPEHDDFEISLGGRPIRGGCKTDKELMVKIPFLVIKESKALFSDNGFILSQR